ncbi:hypothetical protein PspLS_09809 [Pyricularia sp. CBS 133598]|nr:hypothetical protein PspLS_09809 [Pyricularia sp. CBS 133598]
MYEYAAVQIHWVPNKPDGSLAAAEIPITNYDKDHMYALSRIAAFYLRRFDAMVPENNPVRRTSPYSHYLRYARHMTDLLRRGEHKWAFVEWLQDSEQEVLNNIEKYRLMESPDVKIALLVANVMPRFFKGETTMLEQFRTLGLLDDYYSHGFGTGQCIQWVGSILCQLTNSNSHLEILEIGAGTGAATKRILNAVGSDFNTYTFTDISSSFFEKAAETLGSWGNQMVFKVCNAEVDPVAQGFEAGTYDPNGILMLGEGASDSVLQTGAGFIFGTLLGWWCSVEEGRTLSPLVSADEWDDLLRGAGFSGIDARSPAALFDAFGINLFVSTAVYERVALMRELLAPASAPLLKTRPVADGIVILGGETPTVAPLVDEVCAVLAPAAGDMLVFKMLEEYGAATTDPRSVVLSFVDLVAPVFKDVTAERWDAFKPLLEHVGHVIWLTSGRLPIYTAI